MYNIRIKSVPNKAKTGSQLDYSLVDRNTLFLKPNTPVNSDVKNTMGAVPREEATVEAEGGETVIGDINGDGFLEHQTIVGKRHTQGGVPLNIPEGSFIFSDTKKMIIKDPEIHAVFGMKPNKKGYTPAEIAKKYNINDYIAIIKDPAKDKYAKETAQIMLDSNLKKLGMLSLVQESMKGFPDGVPAIAESVMGQMMGGQSQEGSQAPQEEMQEQPQARYGGTQLPKAQFGSNKKQNKIPKVGDVYYLNGVPITISDIETSTAGDWLPNWINDPSGIYFKTPEGEKAYLTFDEFKQMRKLGVKNEPLTKSGRTASSWWTADDNRQYNFGVKPSAQPSRKYKDKEYNIGDVYDTTEGPFQIVDTQYGVEEYNPLLNPKMIAGIGNQYNRTIKVKDLNTNTIKEVRLDELDEALNNELIVPLNGSTNNSNPDATSKGVTIQATTPSATSYTAPVDTTKGSDAVIIGKNKKEGKVVAPVRSFSKDTTSHSFPATGGFSIGKSKDTVFKNGGLTHMQVGGTATYNPDTNTMDTVDATGKIISSVPYSGTSFNVKNKDVIAKARNAGYDVVTNKFGHKINYVPEQTQKTGFTYNPESGYYQNKQFPIGKEGLDETVTMWGDELSGYSGPSGQGAEAWKKDFLNQKGKEGVASRYLIDTANASSVAAGFGPQTDISKRGAYVPGVQVFNLKKFKKPLAPAVIPETPAKKENSDSSPAYPPSIANNREGWSREATLNFMNAFGPRIYRGDPMLQRFNAYAPDYILPNPAQAIAHVLSGVASVNNTADNTMAGNVAFNAKLGALGQGLDQTAKIQAEYDNAGVNIYNQAQAQGAQAFAQNDALNEKAKYQYNNDRQVLDQQFANALNKRRSNVFKAMILGDVEEGKMHAIKTMFPQVGIDNWNKHIGWSGVGRNPFAYDPYINPAGTGVPTTKGAKGFAQGYDLDSINTVASSVYASAKKSGLEQGMSPENAEKYAHEMSILAAKQQMNTSTPGYGTNTASSVYSAMFGNNPYTE